MTVDEIITKIKQEAKINQKDEGLSTEDLTIEFQNIEESQNEKETFLFTCAKKIGKPLQKIGLRGFVNFVRKNINVQKYTTSYSIEDFTQYDDLEFIQNAYQLILNREVDIEGQNNYLSKLREGNLTKSEIVTLLHFSQEGQIQTICIKKTKIIYFLLKGYKIPLFGYFLKSIVVLLNLPKLHKQILKNQNDLARESQKQSKYYEEFTKSLQIQNKYNDELTQSLQKEANSTTLQFQKIQDSLNKKQKKLIKTLQTKVNHEKFEISLHLLTKAKENLQSIIDKAAKKLKKNTFDTEDLHSITKEQNHLYDDLYLHFENEFRGTKENIKENVKVYLPYLETLPFKKDTITILDVGCGRGEWLELLTQHDYKNASGVDLNRVMVSVAKELNLNVKEADVIEHLKSLEDQSLCVITGFHIIEHLPFEVLMSLLYESFRVLKKGGMIIFETPNPRNILVGASDFYLDPTHQNPIHPLTLKFLVTQSGFKKVDSMILDDKKLTNFKELQFNDINDYINIGRDLSVIAYK